MLKLKCTWDHSVQMVDMRWIQLVLDCSLLRDWETVLVLRGLVAPSSFLADITPASVMGLG